MCLIDCSGCPGDVRSMEGDFRESLVVTQDQLDELVAVFKSVIRWIISLLVLEVCSAVLRLSSNVSPIPLECHGLVAQLGREKVF